jgi:GxxExxY protein
LFSRDTSTFGSSADSADFTCFDRGYIIELKAIKALTKVEWAQVIHYLRATRIPYALLVDFGRPEIQYETFELARLPSI